MELLRDLAVSLWSWLVIALLTAAFGSLAILTAWIPPRGRMYLFWARAWARSILFFTGVPATIEISHDAAALPQAIYMSNHESGIDILLLLLVIPQDVRFLAKRSLFWIPFMGWSMWLAGFVPVDRKRTDKAKDVLSELDERLAKGTSILVFPEGTRSRDGTLGPFKKSGFLTALKSGVPIVPVGVSGARAVLGAQGMIVKRGPVRVRAGHPIPTRDLGVKDRPTLMKDVRAEILRLSGAPEAFPAPGSRADG
ncbi:MAG TPA: lysophospholipid acyltransferase family protein [Thermoanaerobaculia bacterium]|nr:lysophospholipid acyltransferase family protein [Thermoanaerobaculia bacterium]